MQMSPQWLDQQYNPLISVRNAGALFSAWNARSAQARLEYDCRLDLSYGPTRRQVLDLFPATGKDVPVFVFIHGGYWRGSDKDSYGFLAPPFVEQGAMVVLLDYELCPGVSIGTICAQIDAALKWVEDNSALYGGDPRRITLAGHSAGAHLAAMAILNKERDTSSVQQAPAAARALCLSGLFDLAPLREAPFIRDDLNLDAVSVRQLSPIHHLPASGVQVRAAVGALESEAFHLQTASLQASWGPDRVAVIDPIENRHHFDLLNDLADPNMSLHREACSLLFAHEAENVSKNGLDTSAK